MLARFAARLSVCPRSFTTLTAATAVVAFVLALAGPASAQQPVSAGDAVQAPPIQQGPLVVQPVSSGPVVAFDVKVTDFDNDTGTLLGGYAGWMTDQRFLLGGAAYWLVDSPNDVELFYGGVLLGWQMPTSKAFRFGVRGLVGGGQATLWDDYYYDGPQHPGWPDRPMPVHGGGGYPPNPGWGRYYFYQGFFVFEPQADATIRFADRVGLHIGVGYRLIAGAGDFNDRLQGITGSVAVQFGVF